LIHDAGLLQARRLEGRSPQPIAIAVSRSGHFPAALPFFRQPLERWLLRAGAAVAAPPTSPPFGFHRYGGFPTWAEALAWLMDHRIERIVVLGGATLATSLLEKGLVDELQLTLVPRLLGGPHLWVPSSALWDGAGDGDSWHLVEHRRLADGEEILVRFRKLQRAGHGAA
jgi:5-amino-6-(5-phosphoribosylamino)uracil reductase